MALRVFTDARCLEHIVPDGFPELPARLEALNVGLKKAGCEVCEAGEHPGRERAIHAVHDADYLLRFENAVASGDPFLDTGDNPLSEGTWRAAQAAVDTCLHAADWVESGRTRKGIAVVRPPGHHAERSMAMGFCYFNNVAISAQYLIDCKKVERVAIFDFDVHHGNGTQHIFEDRGDILYASTHQYPFYPGTGSEQERGRGAGQGATLNIPMPAGSDDRHYGEVLRDVVLPGIQDFKPDALLISAGFDVCLTDPVGGMKVTNEAFRDWGRRLGALSDDLCQGRLLVALEGGYDIQGLASQLLAFCQGLEEDPKGV